MAPPDKDLVNAHSQHRQNFSSVPGTSNFLTVVVLRRKKYEALLGLPCERQKLKDWQILFYFNKKSDQLHFHDIGEMLLLKKDEYV